MSLFGASNWLQSDDDDDDTGTSLFSHSNNYLAVAKEKLEREKRQAEKAKEKQARKKEKSEGKERKTSIKRESDGDGQGSSRQKRIDSGESKKLLAKATAGFINNSDDSEEDTPTPVAKPEVRRSPRGQRTKDVFSPVKPKSRLNAATSVELDDDDEFEITNIVKRPAPPPPPEEDEESDPELAAIKRRARERQRHKQQNTAPNASSMSPAVEDGSGQLPTPPPPDPVVQILVSSDIEGSTPLIVCRKISQNLDPVREAWIKKQGPIIPADMAPNIYFEHCGRRLFNSTLVKRLGIAVDPSGRAYLEDDPSAEGMPKVHVEAGTRELFEKRASERARAAKASAPVDPSPVDEAGEGAEEAQSAQEPQIRLLIKARDKAPFKCRVSADTVIAKIVKNAKKAMGFDESQEAYLEFDGDHLNPEDRVGDTEIEDMENLNLFVSN